MKVLRILIIEDDALLAMLLGEILAGMGHQVCGVAATHSDAVVLASRHAPDLMIVDGSLGQGDGKEAVDEIIRSGWVPHFFMSGDVAVIKAAKPQAIIIQKPFRMSDLTAAITASFAMKNSLRQSAGP